MSYILIGLREVLRDLSMFLSSIVRALFYQSIGINRSLISKQRIMYLDNEDFLAWMEKLSKKLTDIGRDLKLVINTGDAFANEDKLLDNQDLAFLLKVSYRTLQRYRDSGKLRYFLVRRKTFYRMADVKDFIQSYASKKEIVMFNKGIEEGKILKWFCIYYIAEWSKKVRAVFNLSSSPKTPYLTQTPSLYRFGLFG